MTDSIPIPQVPAPQMEAELSFSPVFNLAFQQNAIIWSVRSTSDMFYAPESRPVIRQQIEEIIQTEGPIYETLLKKRIAKAWGFTRARGSIIDILRKCLPDDLTITEFAVKRVFWPRNVFPANYRDYRVGTDRDSKRAIDEIPPEELANAMYEILVDFTSCDRDVLFRETLRLFGLKMTAKAQQYLECALDVLQKTGRV